MHLVESADTLIIAPQAPLFTLTQFCDAVPQCTWDWLKVAHTATFGCLAAEFRRGAWASEA